MSLEDVKKVYKDCKNLNNLCSACHEFCAYRENGVCELNENKIKKDCLESLLNSNLPNDVVWENAFMDVSSLMKFTVNNVDRDKLKSERKAIYSGSFDPFTLGHLDIVKQASDIFDELYIVIAVNLKKKRLLDKNLCAKAIEDVLKRENLTNCKVIVYNGLVAEFCEKENIKYSVRGLRDNMDYNYEEQISNINSEINPNLKTIYLRAERNVSSSMVKELFSYNRDISKYVPDEIKFLMENT